MGYVCCVHARMIFDILCALHLKTPGVPNKLAFLNSCAVFSLSATMRTLSTAMQCIEKQHIRRRQEVCATSLDPPAACPTP